MRFFPSSIFNSKTFKIASTSSEFNRKSHSPTIIIGKIVSRKCCNGPDDLPKLQTSRIPSILSAVSVSSGKIAFMHHCSKGTPCSSNSFRKNPGNFFTFPLVNLSSLATFTRQSASVRTRLWFLFNGRVPVSTSLFPGIVNESQIVESFFFYEEETYLWCAEIQSRSSSSRSQKNWKQKFVRKTVQKGLAKKIKNPFLDLSVTFPKRRQHKNHHRQRSILFFVERTVLCTRRARFIAF